MKRKTIERILNKKFAEWLVSIKDPAVQALVKSRTIITGGSIVSLFNKEAPKDFDVYFTDKETTKAVAKYYVNLFNEKHKEKKNKFGHITKALVLDGADVEYDENGNFLSCLDLDVQAAYANQTIKGHMLTNIDKDRIKIFVRSDGVAFADGQSPSEVFEDVYDVLNAADELPAKELESDTKPEKKFRPVYLSSNAITLSDKVQIIVRFYGDASELHENFDFVHCTNYWTSKYGKLTTNIEALESIIAKNLVYVGSKYPVCSILRMRKFIERGWHINAGNMLKVMLQISELDLHDIAVLEDQLVGVDSAYFMILLDSIRNKLSSDETFEITNDYLFTIIDRIFG